MSVSFFPQTIQLALKMLIEFRIRPNLRALQHSSDSLPSPHASRISLLVSAEDFIAGEGVPHIFRMFFGKAQDVLEEFRSGRQTTVVDQIRTAPPPDRVSNRRIEAEHVGKELQTLRAFLHPSEVATDGHPADCSGFGQGKAAQSSDPLLRDGLSQPEQGTRKS